jgi:restriction system protein
VAGRRYKRKKKPSIFEDLYRWFLDVPAFAPILVAATVWALFALFALITPADATGLQQLGWIAAAIVLAIGVCAQVGKIARRRMLASTHTLDDIARRPWQDFERLVAEVFKLDGWTVSVVGTSAGGRGDGGADILLRRRGEVVAVQCKRARSRIGVEKVRELQGALADFGALRGVFVTLGDFTQEALDFAERRGLELITGHALLRMLPAPAPNASSAEVGMRVPTCPACGSPMLVKHSQRYGAFWGCERYPACRAWRRIDGIIQPPSMEPPVPPQTALLTTPPAITAAYTPSRRRSQELLHGVALATLILGWLCVAGLVANLLDPPSDGPHETAALVVILLLFGVPTLWGSLRLWRARRPVARWPERTAHSASGAGRESKSATH